MDDHHPEIVIIKRHFEHEEEHHGGAWKIAFADFMTAMMAFFLVLWIINATDKNTKTIIARYFNPVRLENPAKSSKGIHETDSLSSDPKKKQKANSNPASSDSQAPGAASEKSPNGKDKGGQPSIGIVTSGVKDPTTKLTESELFADPYASLDRIASGSVRVQQKRLAPLFTPMDTDKEQSDNFKPIMLGGAAYAQSAMDLNNRDQFLGEGKEHDADLQSGPKPAASPSASLLKKQPAQPESLMGNQIASETVKPLVQPKTQALSGAKPEAKNEKAAPSANVEKAAAQIRTQLTATFNAGQKFGLTGPNLEVRANDEGVLISVTDNFNFSMFAIGSAEPQSKTIEAMSEIAHALIKVPGQITVRGFTDGRPFRSKLYDNWRLSSARAQMAYYMLVRGGVPKDRFETIEGFADRRLKDAAHPDAAVNRRIEILVRVDKP